MRIALAALLVGAVMLGGCLRPTAVNNYTLPVAETEPVVSTADGLAGENQLTCQLGTPPTEDEMYELLVKVSNYAPLAYLTGPALAIEQQWLHLEGQGWPPEPDTWASHVWYDLDIAEKAGQPYIVSLQHGIYERSIDRFAVVCDEEQWKIRQFARGNDGPWVEPARELPGQSGELTPDLVLRLVDAVRDSSGPWVEQVTTGDALELARANAIFRARGWKPYVPLKSATNSVKLTSLDENLAEAEFIKSILRVRLRKVDGLWKIQRFTEGGEWVGAPDATRIAQPGRVFDIPPLGIRPGFSDEEFVVQRLGVPDVTTADGASKVFSYHLRGIEATFDDQGKVLNISITSGVLSLSGFKVGGPVQLWELVYGPQPDFEPTIRKPFLIYTARDGKVVKIISKIATQK